MDRTLRGLGIKGDTSTGKPSAVEKLLGGDTAKAAGKADSAKAAARPTAPRPTPPRPPAARFSPR